jgi:large subunit ribosomal protein L15
MKLNELSPPPGSRKTRKRVGRGVGSGAGKTAGRGTKGHNSRSGGGVRPGFEGGQMPLHRRLPKRGFTNIFKNKVAIINVRDLAIFESGETVDEAALIRAGLVKGKRDGIKLLGSGEIKTPLTVRVDWASAKAKEKVEAAGGKIEMPSTEVV